MGFQSVVSAGPELQVPIFDFQDCKQHGDLKGVGTYRTFQIAAAASKGQILRLHSSNVSRL